MATLADYLLQGIKATQISMVWTSSTDALTSLVKLKVYKVNLEPTIILYNLYKKVHQFVED